MVNKATKGKAPAVALPDETTSILRFGVKAYDAYTSTCAPPGVGDLRLNRFGDYLHHFGFSLEKELPDAGAGGTAAHPQSPSLKSDGRARNMHDFIGDDNEPTEAAGWGFPAAEQVEADARAADLGAMTGNLSTKSIAAAIVEPYEHVSWRQTRLQCDFKKIRCIYMWLCANVTIVMEPPPQPKGVAAESVKLLPHVTTAKRAKRPSKKELALAQAAALQVALDPLESALDTRTATPYIAACLLQVMLQSVDVPCDVVRGLQKGTSPEESLPWAWNIITVGGKSHLVDVASATYRAPFGQGSTTPPEPPKAGPGASGGSNGKTAAKPAPSGPRRSPRDVQLLTPAVVLPDISLERGPVLRSDPCRVDDFYFFTHPLAFCYTHLPDEAAHCLLKKFPTRVVWEVAPLLGPDFFRSGVQLRSHRRTCLLTVRSTPFYITVRNDNPATVELCCLLYNTQLKDLPQNITDATPMGPQWVWHQRQESTAEETFTLLAPIGAYYSVVIGVRHIRDDPYSCRITTEKDWFTPIVRYQVKVNFASTTTPVLARQHLSPCICRLVSPLTYQLEPATHHIVVMPSCSNIAAVAVVALMPPPPPTGAPALSEESSIGQRELRGFLTFNSARVVYEGSATFHGGESAELWVLYSAPDRNGLAFKEMIANAEKERPPTPPPVVPVGPSKKSGKSSAPPEISPAELERMHFRRRLDCSSIFLPFITNIAVKKFLLRDARDIIQPQPSLESEAGPTLRRLIGNTKDLYREATAYAHRSSTPPVGTAFETLRHAPSQAKCNAASIS